MGKSIKHVSEKYLKREYAAFHSRVKKGKIHVLDYIKLSILTGKSLDEILMQDPRYADDIKKIREEFGIPETDDEAVDTELTPEAQDLIKDVLGLGEKKPNLCDSDGAQTAGDNLPIAQKEEEAQEAGEKVEISDDFPFEDV